MARSEIAPLKSASAPKTLADWKAKYNAAVDAEYAAAIDATQNFPTLRAHIEGWLPLRRVDAELNAVHAHMEASGAPSAETEHAEGLWRDANDITRAAALRLLNSPAIDPDEIAAKVAAFTCISEKPIVEMTDECGDSNELVAGLLKDVARQAEAKRQATTDRTAWEAARAAYLAAEARQLPEDATPEQHEADMDAAADAHAKLLATPAPDLEAVAEKLSFVGEFMEFNAFLDEQRAREIFDAGSWPDRCVASAYLDLLRMANPTCPVAGAAGTLIRAFDDECAACVAMASPQYEAAVRRRDAIEAKLIETPAQSLKGAGIQFAMAMMFAERIRGAPPERQDLRDENHDVFERLMRSALSVIADAIPEEIWTAYVGGDRPAGSSAVQVATSVPGCMGDPGLLRFGFLLGLNRQLEEALRAAETDEEGDLISAELAQNDRAIMALPCTDPAIVREKLRLVKIGLRSGELGGEEEALDDVIAWLDGLGDRLNEMPSEAIDHLKVNAGVGQTIPHAESAADEGATALMAAE